MNRNYFDKPLQGSRDGANYGHHNLVGIDVEPARGFFSATIIMFVLLGIGYFIWEFLR
ncbi:MAG TPA: hypothetical protein VN081_02375 [Dongiaceae bacterium]|nr:hypothetical protein [Dongiaceae bacterium]